MSSSSSTVIESIYDALNQRNIAGAMEWVDDDCRYEDLNFPQPFQGKNAVEQLFQESLEGIPEDLLFVIDEITTGDSLGVGVLWHVELGGIPFPNGRGASFYRLSETTGKLIFARDVVEPPLKPGKFAFWIIRLVTPLVRRFLKPSPVQPETRQGNLTTFWLGLLAIAYIYILLLSPPNQLLPGEPAWAIQPETLQEVLGESLNFFFILPILNGVGFHFMEAATLHPTSEVLFNLAEAWIFMFLPLLLLDVRGNKLPKIPLWSGAMFLTNAILTPYMALRYRNPLSPPSEELKKGRLAKVFGTIGLGVGLIAIAWFFTARPEFGGISERVQYFLEKIKSDRVTIAFCVDLVFFAVFQSILMGAIIPKINPQRWLRFIPFWGLSLWLIL